MSPLELLVAGKRLRRPLRASGDHGNVDCRKLACERLANARHDIADIGCGIAQLVDIVDEDENAIAMQAAENSERRKLDGRQRLACAQDDHIKLGRLERVPCDFVPNHERVVDAGRRDDGNRELEWPAG